MRLSEIVGAATGLAVYAEVALVLFLAAFAAVVFQVFSRRRAADWEAARNLPLADALAPATDAARGTRVAPKEHQS